MNMHGHYYPNYVQQPQTRVAQSPGSNNRSQSGQSHLVSQYAGQLQQAASALDGQMFQSNGHLQHIQHHPGLSQHQAYNALLQQQHYPGLYNATLRNQSHPQSVMQQQPLAAAYQSQQQLSDHSASLRSLLSSQYRQGLNISQLQNLNQIGLGQSSVPQHTVDTHAQRTEQSVLQKAATSRLLIASEQTRNISRESSQPINHRQSLAPPPPLHTMHSNQSQSSSSPSLLNSDGVRPHHISPQAHSRITGGMYQQNSSNPYQGLLLSPEMQRTSDIISPRRTSYSPAQMTHRSQISMLGMPPNSGTRPESVTQIQPQPQHQSGHGTRYTSNTNLTHSTTHENPVFNQNISSPPSTHQGGVITTNVYVKRQTSSVNSCSAPVIISDSDDDEDERQRIHETNSQQTQRHAARIRKDDKGVAAQSTHIVIDDDIEIIGVRQAEIMSHMRADCPIHLFRRIDDVNKPPDDQNSLCCSKCYCYVCDKLAKECSTWKNSTFPHCNSHSRASGWKARRNTKKSPLMARLQNDEITSEISLAGENAMQYMIKIREAYITYRAGTACEYNLVPCNCTCHRASRGHDPCIQCKSVHDVKKKFNYAPVRDVTIDVVNEIHSKYSLTHAIPAIIMLEAALAELCQHRPADFNHNTRSASNPDTRCQCNTPVIMEQYIEKELVEVLTRHEVPRQFRSYLIDCVQDAVKPLQLKDVMKRFFGMRHWDDLLLRGVLSGSNITGSKNRDVLREAPDIVKLRVEKLDREKRYLSITRYLKTVKIYNTPKSSLSASDLNSLIEQWSLLYSAKQGQFKEICLRLTEPNPKNPTGCTLGTLEPEFLIEVLDALAGKNILPNTNLDSFIHSFESSRNSTEYSLIGQDADILFLIFQYILDQNGKAGNYFPCYRWLAEWVNRVPLEPCVNPTLIRQWIEAGTHIINQSHQACMLGQCQTLLFRCNVHNPQVHLFAASMNILSFIHKQRNQVLEEDIQKIIDSYKNNEWALFNLLTQPGMLTLGIGKVLQWIAEYSNDKEILPQFNENNLREAFPCHSVDDVLNLMTSIIKPDWTRSIISLQRAVITVSSAFAERLFKELAKTNNRKSLQVYTSWLENTIVQKASEPSLLNSLRQDEIIATNLKSVAKICSFLHPIKKNISFYKSLSPAGEWFERSSKLMQFLRERPHPLAMDELSSCMELALTDGNMEEMKYIFSLFQEHSCQDKEDPTSTKVLQNIASLIESAPVELQYQKEMMLSASYQLCSHEALSWLICTDCAKKMPTSWTRIWLSLARTGMVQSLKQLNIATMDQFKSWLKELSLKNSEDYNRLIKCLQSFLYTLITTWHKCNVTLDMSRNVLLETSLAFKDPRLQRDFVSMVHNLVQAEMEKMKPKVIEHASPKPPNRITPALSTSIPSSVTPSHPPKQAEMSVRILPVPPPLIPSDNSNTQKVITKTPPQIPRCLPTTILSPTRPHVSTANVSSTVSTVDNPKRQAKPQAIMSTDALFKKDNQTTVKETKKTPEPVKISSHKGPFSPTNPTRTRTCPKCNATISCASFKCPQCQQVARSVQTVKCPDCGQENRELKGYSCQYCYRSLLDVLFGGGGEKKEEKNREEFDKSKANHVAEKHKKKIKRKHEKTRSKEEKNNMIVTKENSEVAPFNNRIVEPLKIKVQYKEKSLSESDTDSSEDFIRIQPPKKRRKETKSNKIPPLIINRRKMSVAASQSDDDNEEDDDQEEQVDGFKSVRAETLSDEDEEVESVFENSQMNDNNMKQKQRHHSNSTKYENNIPEKIGTVNSSIHWTKHIESSPIKQITHVGDDTGIDMGSITPLPKPEFYSKPQEANSVARDSPKMAASGILDPGMGNPATAKRGVGHSSMMSKHQKSILSRMKRFGKGAPKKISQNAGVKITPPKLTPPNNSRDMIRSPGSMHQKKPLFTSSMITLPNGPVTSPLHSPIRRASLDILKADRSRTESSCSSSSSSLSFSLASVERREKKNKEHGHKSSKLKHSGHSDRRVEENHRNHKYEANKTMLSPGSNTEIIFPQPLTSNHVKDAYTKKKNKRRKKRRDIQFQNDFRLSEKDFEKLVMARKPGPASRTGYRQVLKAMHRMKKKTPKPHPRWRIPSDVSYPRRVDLSRYPVVSLSQFPMSRLMKIRRLLNNYSILSLYA